MTRNDGTPSEDEDPNFGSCNVFEFNIERISVLYKYEVLSSDQICTNYQWDRPEHGPESDGRRLLTDEKVKSAGT